MDGKTDANPGLLDWLTDECGCSYLSNLRLAETVPALLRAVRRIPPGRWSDETWSEAVNYITGEQVKVRDEASARQALEAWQGE